jgi:hypothetical protein
VQAENLINGQNYHREDELHAEPTLIRMSQADAMKNGRRVRLGIDFRANLEIANGFPPSCTQPGISAGGGSLAVGTRLWGTRSCADGEGSYSLTKSGDKVAIGMLARGGNSVLRARRRNAGIDPQHRSAASHPERREIHLHWPRRSHISLKRI